MRKTISELSVKVKQKRTFPFRALSLFNLALDIIEAILNGREPPTLTLHEIRKRLSEDRNEQRKMFWGLINNIMLSAHRGAIPARFLSGEEGEFSELPMINKKHNSV